MYKANIIKEKEVIDFRGEHARGLREGSLERLEGGKCGTSDIILSQLEILLKKRNTNRKVTPRACQRL